MNGLSCKNEHRREKVRQHAQLNGLDYLEVCSEKSILTVHFLGKAPVQLDNTQIRIEGGRRIRDIQVDKVSVHCQKSVEFDDTMEVEVNKIGDFSNYTLRVVEKNKQGEWLPHSQFDPRYDRIEFNFNVDCPNELDCKQDSICPAEQQQEPEINYLAKDYVSFRQLILDRLALVMPDWQERHVPDIGIALVEVFAYVGDHLSYFQDAVATEAYLDTARKRLSIRRHARLVDYAMHEGCNARAWICIQVSSDLDPIQPEDINFITGFNDSLQTVETLLTAEELQQYPASQYEVFQPVSKKQIQLYKDHNRITFYTWGDQQCCLPQGSTSATLLGEWISGEIDKVKPPCDSEGDAIEVAAEQEAIAISNIKLHLKVGDILIFEEVMGPETGHPQDANPKHRHAVRLTVVSGDIDPLNGQPITHISWDEDDALPFPLCLSVLGPAPECKMLEEVSIAWANVVLVDHGQTFDQDLESVPQGEFVECCKGEDRLADGFYTAGFYNPKLASLPLTFSEPWQDPKAASSMLKQNPRLALPKIELSSFYGSSEPQAWQSRVDLLSCQSDDFHYVAELDNEGRAYLRFGNDEMGRRPQAGTTFSAKYRIGNGLAGNVGAEAISHLVLANTTLSGVSVKVRNPMPAQGGIAPEPISEVKLFAPHAFRKQLQRAIIADDYAAIVLREFKDKVQNAIAKLRWNGSWYEVLLAIDPFGQEQAEQALLDEISQRLHRYRRMGHDLVVKSAHRVPLNIELEVCVLPNYLRGHVKAELLKVFSNKRLADGQLGFFHPDKLTFGEDIYLSKLVAAAQSVEGVASVTVNIMQRWCELANEEIEKGLLPLSPGEIARLDNDPSFPENGKLTLEMRGGR